MFSSLIKYVIIAASIVLVVLQIHVHLDAIVTPLHVKNEFYYLDQKTKLENGGLVDNKQFDETLVFSGADSAKNYKFNSLKILSDKNSRIDINSPPYFKYYPDVSSDVDLRKGRKFLDKVNYLVLDADYDKVIFYANKKLFDFYSRDCDNQLDMNEIRSYFDFGGHSHRYSKDIEESLHACAGNSNLILPLVYADTQLEVSQKIDYIEKNFDEKLIQTYDRYYFHESNFVLNPVNDLLLNRPKGEIFSQYGYLSAVLFKNVMEFIGGISYPNYEKAIKGIYLLYYITSIYIFFACFKSSNAIRLLLIALIAYSLYANSYYFYTYPPGHAPFRHFFDILVFWFLWRAADGRLVNYIFAIIFSAISIYMDKDIGAIIALAAFGSIIYCIMQRLFSNQEINKGLYLLIGASLVGLAFCYFSYPLASNPSAKYFLDGFYSFGVGGDNFIRLLLNCVVLVLVAIWMGGSLYKDGLLMPYIFAAIYSSLLYFYYVWGGGHAHYRVFITMYWLPYLVLLYHVIKTVRLELYISLIVAGLVLVVLPKKIIIFFADKNYSITSFENHQTYTWTLPRAKGMITKVDPEPFELAVGLIEKYEGDKSFAPISKYDSMLSFLAGKYSRNPFFDLRSFIVTEDDYEVVRESLLKNKTIFVDVDIDRDFDLELSKLTIWNYAPIFFYEHYYQRLGKLMVLKRLYKDIIADGYQEVDRSGLIAVYQRK